MAKEKGAAETVRVRVLGAEDVGGAVALRNPREVAKRARPAGTVSVNPGRLLLAAVKGKVAPESLKAIMDMRRELVEEQAKREYYDALTKFQAHLKPIVKSKVVKNKAERIAEGQDPVRFRYAPIEKIVAAIQVDEGRYGFSHTFDSDKIADGVISVHTFIHHVGGHTERTTFPSPLFYEDGKAIGQSKAQTVNGAITFGRRVGLVMGYGIMSADPDPEMVEGENAKRAEASEPRTVEQAQAEKPARAAGKKLDLDAVMAEVTELVEKKCSGKAAATFVATAYKHYDAGREDLLAALRDSLKGMRQGAGK